MNGLNASETVINIDVEQVLRNRLPRVAKFLPKSIIEWLKRTICQDELNELLAANAGKTGVEFCRGVLRSLGITTELRGAENLPDPANRRVVLVCNHPLGGLDGVALIDVVQRHFGGQVWFVVNDLLMAVKPLENVFLPINKYGSQSRTSTVKLDEAFAGNDPIIVFPAGLVSRLQKLPVDGRMVTMVHDLQWHKMFVNKCVQFKRDLVPMFFSGQNSGDFYRKARWRKRLGIKFNIEMVYLPREMFLAKGKSFTVFVGALKKYGELVGGKKALECASAICDEVYRLPRQFSAE